MGLSPRPYFFRSTAASDLGIYGQRQARRSLRCLDEKSLPHLVCPEVGTLAMVPEPACDNPSSTTGTTGADILTTADSST